MMKWRGIEGIGPCLF